MRFWYCLLCFALQQATGQTDTIWQTYHLKIVPTWHQEPLVLQNKYPINNQEQVQFTVFKWYLSAFFLKNKDQLVYQCKQQPVLMDAEKPKTWDISLQIPTNVAFDQLCFVFGIDEKTNDAGIGAGDLDPAKGMYWTWETGYIHCKLEGNRFNKKNKQTFTAHIGGFLPPFAAMQHKILAVHSSNNELTAMIDLACFWPYFSAQKKQNLMTPSAEAVQWSQQLIQCLHE